MAQQLTQVNEVEEFNRMAENQCNFCQNVSENCKTCEKCLAVRYCSKKCQVEAFGRHKTYCIKIDDLTRKMNQEMAKLRQMSPNDMFYPFGERGLGNYWGLLEPRDWCHYKQQLGRATVESGMKEKNLYGFKLALDEHYMELLRLNHGDNQGIRYDAPFLLLFSGQYQKCYDLIAWFSTIGNDEDYDWGEAPKIAKGEWKYLVDEDILGELNEVETPHLLSLVLLKMIIIRDLRTGKHYPSFSRAIQNLKHEEDIAMIRQNEIARQEAILKRYLTKMEKKNKFILKAIVNPGPMRDLDWPECYSSGSIEEAQTMLDYDFYFQHFGMMEQLAQRFSGQNLNYLR